MEMAKYFGIYKSTMVNKKWKETTRKEWKIAPTEAETVTSKPILQYTKPPSAAGPHGHSSCIHLPIWGGVQMDAGSIHWYHLFSNMYLRSHSR